MPITNTKSASAEAVLEALRSGPASAAEIAEAAGLGRSTATRALAALEADGQVTRRAGGRDDSRQMPDRWSLPRRTESRGRGQRGDAGAKTARLGKGELAGMVLAQLRAHPGEHSPHGVAKALDGRSSGAVGNALARLVATGDAVQASHAPRRYRAARRRSG